jgi:hypothetical protein
MPKTGSFPVPNRYLGKAVVGRQLWVLSGKRRPTSLRHPQPATHNPQLSPPPPYRRVLLGSQCVKPQIQTPTRFNTKNTKQDRAGPTSAPASTSGLPILSSSFCLPPSDFCILASVFCPLIRFQLPGRERRDAQRPGHHRRRLGRPRSPSSRRRAKTAAGLYGAWTPANGITRGVPVAPPGRQGTVAMSDVPIPFGTSIVTGDGCIVFGTGS